MLGPKNVRRKAQIAKVLAKHGFGFLVEKIGLGRFVPFHWGILGHPKRGERYSAQGASQDGFLRARAHLHKARSDTQHTA